MANVRPGSRIGSRRSAMHNITDGVDQIDMFMLSIDYELKLDNIKKIKNCLNNKNYDNAVDNVVKMDRKNDDEDMYSLILNDLDNELKEIIDEGGNNKKPRKLNNDNKQLNNNLN